MIEYAMSFDVCVVGAGHAGIEAALASARTGASTLLLTMNVETIGQMSCNPAIGGIAKGHLVREIDALGGEMGRAIDRTGIQFRRLNTRKGPAVRASRAQADRARYAAYMREVVQKAPGLTLCQDEAVALWIENDTLVGVEGRAGMRYRAGSVVLTSGTFLRGLIHIGLKNFPGGRAGDPDAELLGDNLRWLGLPAGRMKTGTPPRLNGRTIDWERLQVQHGDEDFTPFSVDTRAVRTDQTPCYITYTNERTHEVIRSGMDRSPLYTGVIEGVGPRYCPSIEDKVKKFPDRSRHQLFLEPEGAETHEVYPNGISTSLPLDVQVELVRTIEGLENAHIIKPGYAIEYDFFDPRDLYPSLESKTIPGLFLAGQVNGTSGYEEAGAQGLLAGLNASRRSGGKQPVIVGRHQGYLGVLVDDLVNKGVNDPYRMFTSRAEYRLLLREDNCDMRLSPIAVDTGLLTDERKAGFFKKLIDVKALQEFIHEAKLPVTEAAKKLFERKGAGGLKPGQRLSELVRRPELSLGDLVPLVDGWPTTRKDALEVVEVEVKYAGYIERDLEMVDKMSNLESIALPSDLDYELVTGLTIEARQKLSAAKPLTLGQAQRIPGVNPSSTTVVLVHLRKTGVL